MGPLTWDAVATLVTGLAAVIGAVAVGWRQVGISQEQTAIAARQAEILGEQVKLEKLGFHESMFDRRMEVYEAVAAFVVYIVQHAAAPSQTVERAYLNAMGRARFLFRPEVNESLSELWKQACSYQALKAVMDHKFATEGTYGEGAPQQESKLLIWFSNRLETLPDLFGDELKLGHQ